MGDLITSLKQDFPDFHFTYGKRFSFRPPKTIVIGPDEGTKTPLLIFHELGHALSGQYIYKTAIERLKIESLAWNEGKKAYEKCLTSGRYSLPPWDEEFVEENLDTYRDWLHAKSKCKTCGLTMYQGADKKWLCPFCSTYRPPNH